jgi:hypothetical protein
MKDKTRVGKIFRRGPDRSNSGPRTFHQPIDAKGHASHDQRKGTLTQWKKVEGRKRDIEQPPRRGIKQGKNALGPDGYVAPDPTGHEATERENEQNEHAKAHLQNRTGFNLADGIACSLLV